MAELIESATLVKYNANIRGNDVGDCVCRSLSLAFNVSYSDMSKQLNAAMKQVRATKWNIAPVYEKVILQNNGSMPYTVDPDDKMTVDQFAEKYPKYCYLIRCGKDPKSSRSTHIVCIIDGKIYDSWDCREWYVKKYYTCSYNRHIEESDLESHMEELGDYAEDLVRQELQKYGFKWIDRGLGVSIDFDYVTNVNNLLIEQAWWAEYTFTNAAGGEAETSKIRFSINIPLKPGMSVDDAKTFITKVGKQRAYDRMYAVRERIKKDLEAYEAAHEHVEGDDAEVADQRWLFLDAREKRFLNQLPGKIRPYIAYIRIYDPGQHSNSYDLHIKRMPRDPNPRKDFRIEAYDAYAAKDMVKRYVEKFERPYDDYSPYEDY